MNNQQTEKTSQNLENLSFDKTFDISARLLKGFDADNNVLRPIATDSTGQVKIIGALSQSQADASFLKLDQTTPQHITSGSPIFDEGITIASGKKIYLDG